MQDQEKIIPVILSGGAGMRLWPLSTDERPKSFIPMLPGQKPIIEETLARINNRPMFGAPVIIGNHLHRNLLLGAMQCCDIENSVLLLEPIGRNTAPAILTAAQFIQKHYGNRLMLVLPTDHLIQNVERFISAVNAAAAVVQDRLVTFGIKPHYAETGYGYIQKGKSLGSSAVCEIMAFKEKPDAQTAENYLQSGEYLWNSGMFLFSSGALLDEAAHLQPELFTANQIAFCHHSQNENIIQFDQNYYAAQQNISIDYAIMEQTQKGIVMPLDCGWSDTGTWDLLWQHSPRDHAGNVVIGDCHVVNCQNCYIRNETSEKIYVTDRHGCAVIANENEMHEFQLKQISA